MGFLDNVKKNLGLGGKDHGGKERGGEASARRQAAEDSAAVEVSASDRGAAAAAAAEAGQQGPVAPQVTEVVVEPGDTMRGIAAQFGVDLGALIATNSDTVPNPDAIYPGQVLRLP